MQQKQQEHIPGNAKEDFAIDKKYNRYFLAGILVLTAVIFGKSIFHQFVDLDDPQYILNNYVIQRLSFANIKEIFTSFSTGNYHPLTTTMNAVQFYFFGLQPGYWHFTNLLFHLANTGLVFCLFYRFTEKTEVAIITALFFGIHPMHVESVAWVSELKDLSYSLYYLASLISYNNYIRKRKPESMFPVASFIFFILSVLSKSAAITLPVILFLFDYYYGRKPTLKSFAEKGPFLLVSLCFGIVAIISQKSAHAISDLSIQYSFLERLLLTSYSISYYIVRLFMPSDLSVMHPYPSRVNGMLPVEFYLSPLLLILVVIAVYFSGRYRKVLIFGTLFFLITISLVLHIVPVGQAIVAERYTYIPYLGLFFIAGDYYYTLAEKERNRLNFLFWVMICFAISFSVLTYKRNLVWRDSATLFTDASNKYPLINPLIYNNLGTSRFKEKDYVGAIEAFDMALKIDAKNAYAYNNRGSAKLSLNRFEEASADFSNAIRQDPGFSDAYRNRGVLKYSRHDYAGSIDDFSKAITHNSGDVLSLFFRGTSKSKLNDMSGACTDWNESYRKGYDKALGVVQQNCR